MRILAKPPVAAALALAVGIIFIQAPLIGSPAGIVNPPVGVIAQADQARIGTGTAAVGTSLFNGDAIGTGPNGSMRIRFGASQAYLLPGSSAYIRQAPQGFSAELAEGTMILSSVQGETFRLIADGATIRPSTSQATSAQIMRVGPTELVLLARKGALQVSMDDDVKTVPEGASYRMMIQPPEAAAAPSPSPASPSVFSAGQNRFLFFALAAVAIGVAIGVYFATVSPSKL